MHATGINCVSFSAQICIEVSIPPTVGWNNSEIGYFPDS